ncbi:MAG: hypothetical protein WCP63_04330 [Cyanobium sp. ELA712]
METARLFQSGRSQAVRLPKDYRFRTTASAAAKWPSSTFDVHDRSKLYTSSLGLSMREAVELALRTLVKLQQQGEIRAFRGRLAWEGDLETQRLDHETAELQA